MTHHSTPLLLGIDVSSRSPHPSLERVTHHGPPPLGPPSLGARYRLVRPHPLAPPPPEKDDSPPPPLPSSWCLLQTGTSPPLGSAGGPPPLGACYKLVRPLLLLGACYKLVRPSPWLPLPLVSVTDWYDPHLCNVDDIWLMGVMFWHWEQQCAWLMIVIVILSVCMIIERQEVDDDSS